MIMGITTSAVHWGAVIAEFTHVSVLSRFESRWATVEVRGGSPAIMLAGMEGSNLGIWCVDGTGAAAASAVALVHLVLRRTEMRGLSWEACCGRCAHGEGRCFFPDAAVRDTVLQGSLAPLRCVSRPASLLQSRRQLA